MPDQALPRAFCERMRRLLGQEYGAFLEAFSRPALRGARVNLLKCGPERFAALSPLPLSSVPFAPEGFAFKEGGVLNGRHPLHHAGVFYLQEPSAMAAVTAAGILPGMRVLDLCAAPGGKATQAAARLSGKGVLVANEVMPARAKALLSNIERCGVRNAAVLNDRPEAVCGTLMGCFDVVLCDAPCSGEGMFRREPEALAQWRPELPAECARRQLHIIESAAMAVKEGGVLVYSTCTFAPEENEGVVGAFLHTHPDFDIEPIAAAFGRPALPEYGGDGRLSLARRIYPMDGGEGHFVARLRRISPLACNVREYQPPALSGEAAAQFSGFWGSQFEGEPFGAPCVIGGKVYLMPEVLPGLQGLRVLRAGVPAGKLINGRFEPEHALYLASPAGSLRNVCDFALDDPLLFGYLRGEELPAAEGLRPGWAGVSAASFTVGFGKVAGGRLKNRYPRGLRNLR